MKLFIRSRLAERNGLDYYWIKHISLIDIWVFEYDWHPCPVIPGSIKRAKTIDELKSIELKGFACSLKLKEILKKEGYPSSTFLLDNILEYRHKKYKEDNVKLKSDLNILVNYRKNILENPLFKDWYKVTISIDILPYAKKLLKDLTKKESIPRKKYLSYDITSWLDENVSPNEYTKVWTNNGKILYLFKNKNDAIAFKLRWS